MEPGGVVKAVYDFPTEEEGELSLHVGDVIQVLRKVNKQWFYGICNGQQGNFPSNFALEIKVPPLSKDQHLFAAVNDFVAQEAGDLSFKRGDLIVANKPVDANWWEGELNGQKGIFPITHIWQLDLKLLNKSEAPKKVFLKARVKMDMKAQLKEEIDLNKDEVVTITEIVDKDWYRGECSGRSGIFPSSFVTVLDGQNENTTDVIELNCQLQCSYLNGNEIPSKSSNKQFTEMNNHYGYDCLNSGITAYGRTLYPFKAEYSNELTFGEGELVNLVRHVDDQWMEGEIDGKIGLFPKDFIDIIVDCPTSNNKTSGNDSSPLSAQPDVHIFPADTYGRVLYDFYPQMEGDVKLKEGDTVTLVRKIDQNWYEVITDEGDDGICPSTFIEVIGSGPDPPPPSYSEVMKAVSSNMQHNKFPDASTNNWNVISLNNSVNTTKSEKPYSYSTLFDEQTSSSKFSVPSGVSLKASQKSIEDKIAESLIELDLSSTSSNQLGVLNGQHQSACNDDVLYPMRSEILEPPLSSSQSMGKHIHAFSEDQVDNSSSAVGSQGTTVGTSSRFWDAAPDLLASSPNATSVNYRGGTDPGKGDTKGAAIPNVRTPTSPPTIIWPVSRQSSTTSGSQHLPQRAAPPAPLHRRSSIISLDISTEGSELNEDIQQQISNKENQVKRLESCKSKLELELEHNPDQKGFVVSDLQQQIGQFDDEIDGIKKEIKILQDDLQKQFFGSSDDEDQKRKRDQDVVRREEEVKKRRLEEEKRRAQERIKKMKEQRECVITEILQTERDYIQDLKILYDTFLKQPEEGKAKGVDVATLFGNLDEVIDMASRLLRRIEKTASGNCENQMIGECFVDMADEMKEVYGHYCRNHDDVNAVLDRYEEKSLAGHYLKHKLEIMKRQTNCFDLPSMLIKPVQRILKYPLLLNELVKCTEDSHADKQWLIKAIGLMTDVATAINEFKRRKDLVFKYRKHADTSLSGRISKLNFHSMWKKSARLGMRLSNSIGLTSVTKDETFEKAERKFQSLEKSIKIFLKDISAYSEKTEELVQTAFYMAEDIADLYQERKSQQEVDQFRSAHRIIVTQFWEAFKVSMERSVATPLRQLLQTFQGPNNLIQKRYDKLLDYEACTNKLEKNKDATKIKMLQDSQQMAKNTYEALNSQLLDDLPKLFSAATEILRDCIRSFLKSKKSFIGKTARHMLSLMELPLLLGAQGGVLETFQVKHTLVTDHLCQLTLVPKQLFPSSKSDSLKRNSSPRSSSLSFGASPPVTGAKAIQSPSQKVYVKSHYHTSQLYSACQNYDAVDLLDISIKKGDVVGVIKQQDPMGSKLRWFVDNGAVKGFVPAKFLMKFLADPSNLSKSPVSCSQIPQQSQGVGRNASSLLPYQYTPPTANSEASRPTCVGSNAVVPQYSHSQTFNTPNQDMKLRVRNSPQPSRPAPPVIINRNPNLSSTSRTQSLSLPYPSHLPTVRERREVASAPVRQPSVNSINCDRGTGARNGIYELANPETPHRYEEIDDLLCKENRYDVICDDVSTTDGILKPSTNGHRYSNVPLNEFDPYAQQKSTGTLYDNVPDTSSDLYSSHRYEAIPDDEIDSTVLPLCESQESEEYYYAFYDFTPLGPNQLNLSKGQVVLVLHKCDLNKNADWWFVKNRHGNEGYVPGGYLRKYTENFGQT